MRHREAVAKIRYHLIKAGLTCSAIDRQYGLYAHQAQDAIFEPNEAGERAIAAALHMEPKELWPHRFDTKTGKRLTQIGRAHV